MEERLTHPAAGSDCEDVTHSEGVGWGVDWSEMLYCSLSTVATLLDWPVNLHCKNLEIFLLHVDRETVKLNSNHCTGQHREGGGGG